jgi:hypothetical protein
MERLPAHLRGSYVHDFHLADDAFYAGQLKVTFHGQLMYLDHWQRYQMPMGVDPYLQDATFSKQIRLLSGFTARVKTGYYGKRQQAKNFTVSSALMVIGQTIKLACNSNPNKVVWSKCLLP